MCFSSFWQYFIFISLGKRIHTHLPLPTLPTSLLHAVITWLHPAICKTSHLHAAAKREGSLCRVSHLPPTHTLFVIENSHLIRLLFVSMVTTSTQCQLPWQHCVTCRWWSKSHLLWSLICVCSVCTCLSEWTELYCSGLKPYRKNFRIPQIQNWNNTYESETRELGKQWRLDGRNKVYCSVKLRFPSMRVSAQANWSVCSLNDGWRTE